MLSSLRNKDTPKIDSTYTDRIFGTGKNGICERVCLYFGHLNVETLKMTETKVKGNNIDDDVRILR